MDKKKLFTPSEATIKRLVKSAEDLSELGKGFKMEFGFGEVEFKFDERASVYRAKEGEVTF